VQPLKLVLDTNVWLDWLVFDDASVAPIRAAAERRSAEIFIDDACADELKKVLGYSLRKKIMSAAEQTACLGECRRVAQAVTANSADATDVLPKCRDADDQKFLELARACGADYLITKDLLLLELAQRKVKRTPFGIVTPRDFAEIAGGGRGGGKREE
jgi:uncharacterized protein